MPIYIIGHTSPDLDSVVSAISFSELKNKIENTNEYVPALAGEPNKETKYLLEKYNIDIPEKLDNLKDKKVVLVDHNETSQSLEGVEEAEIMEVLDHHKISFESTGPLKFRVYPLGSTATIIAKDFLNNNLGISKSLASIMLGAILVDTVITKSPTCTEIDKEVIEKLAQIAEISDWKEYGMEVFKVRSDIGSLSDEDLIKSDYKEYEIDGKKFLIGQVETVDLEMYKNRYESLLQTLNSIKEQEDYHSCILFISDIIQEGSEFLVASEEKERLEKAFDTDFANNVNYLSGIMSRKKQVIPALNNEFKN